MHRRTVLRLLGAFTGSALLPPSRPAQAAGNAPLRLVPGPHLLLDDALIDTQARFQRVTTPPQRLGHPVVTGKQDGNFQPYVSVVRDPATRKFRIWYDVPAKHGQAAPSRLAYMESDDGIAWKRPHRILDNPGGLEVRFGASVTDQGPAFADRPRRFKLAWYTGPCAIPAGGLMVATSPDGLHWTPVADHAPVLSHDHDINSLFRDPIRGHWGAIVSMIGKKPGRSHNRRITYQSVSEDLVHWKTPWPILVPDERDQPNTEFYAMSGVIARGGLLIGLVKVLRDDLPADAGGPARGIGYTTLAWSRDGITWVREREPFHPRNPEPGSWDHAMTWGDCQLPVGDEVFIYYGGYARGHKVERFTERQIGLARMKTDRYIALRAGTTRATLRTRPLLLNGKSLAINAAIRGRLIVHLLDTSAKPIAPPVTLKGDATAHPVDWPLAAQRTRPVRIEFQAEDADVFALNLSA